MYKRLAIAFSVANLCFFKTWSEVLSPPALNYLYFWKDYPGYVSVITLATNVLLLTAIFFAGFHLVWRIGGATFHNLACASFLVIFLRALNGVRVHFVTLSTHELRQLFGRVGFFALGLLLLSLLVVVTLRYGLARVSQAAAVIALVLAPFGVLALSQATWLAVKYGRMWQEEPSAPVLETNVKGQPRVLWLIFDEMSQELAFANRPPSLDLPNFDRLRAEALLATNAFPPAGHTTQSIPALLTGRLIAAVKPAGPGELMLTFAAGQTAVGWSSQPDIFTEARAAGFNTALAGWYHPYCRVIGHQLTSCTWEPFVSRDGPRRLTMPARLLRQQSDLLPLLPFTGRLRNRLIQVTTEDYRIPQRSAYEALLAGAIRAATNPNLGLTFVHLPIPHPPYVYDRRRGVWETSEQLEYLDNLALADKALGDLRQAMERAGTWENTTIVISSDHWWRTDLWQPARIDSFFSQTDARNVRDRVDHRIPFLVRMAGQTTGSRYQAEFNTVLTHDLILDILKRRISSADQLATWLDTHRTIGESPYQEYDDPK